jgi:hypothetical protein
MCGLYKDFEAGVKSLDAPTCCGSATGIGNNTYFKKTRKKSLAKKIEARYQCPCHQRRVHFSPQRNVSAPVLVGLQGNLPPNTWTGSL